MIGTLHHLLLLQVYIGSGGVFDIPTNFQWSTLLPVSRKVGWTRLQCDGWNVTAVEFLEVEGWYGGEMIIRKHGEVVSR